MSNDISCKIIHSDYNICENCIKNNLNNCNTCPGNIGKCIACKYRK